MRKALKYLSILLALFVGFAVWLFEWSSRADQERFRAAKNDCERGCIQDSGGLEQCRATCVSHPNRYP